MMQDERLEAERRQRDRDAAITPLPTALSKMATYASKCGALLHELLSRDPEGRHIGDLADLQPELEDKVIGVFANAVRADPLLMGPLGRLTSDFQVQQSRLRRRVSDGYQGRHTRREICSSMLDAAELHGRATALLGYARRLDPVPAPVVRDDIRSGLGYAGIGTGRYSELDELLEQRWPRESKQS